MAELIALDNVTKPPSDVTVRTLTPVVLLTKV